MTSERAQLHYTCVFLQVSFQAVKKSLPQGDATDTTPCWLDAEMLRMLLRELKNSREAAAPFPEVRAALDVATYHCGLLMAQCPGALDQALCRYHLDAVIAPLQQSVHGLCGSDATRQASPRRRLRDWLRH
ncbi:hypothetical protein [Salinicola aestuarinus]|uniref:hypothetical protein n=1 Tax=Salinicola aestuarinus TaxID=1949082 RepID=UPI000DA15BD8|nr:hypothetical protein [Salinicola aestuarinus]